MKRILCAALALILLILPTTPAAAAEPITVQVNGQPLALEVDPLVEVGYTLVPVRAIAESLGASVSWYAEARRVEIELNETLLALTIDNTIAYVNGVPKQLDAPARIVNGYTLVPARFISESLNAEVKWDANTRTVSIVTYENVNPYSSTLAQLESAVLQELNQRRAKLNRAPLLGVEELTQMARSHAAELARTGKFTHNSSRFGGAATRAAARGLSVHIEYLAFGLPDAAAIADALVGGDQGGRLLAEEARFWGLGLYKAGQDGNADIYAVAELTEGLGFIQGARQHRLNGPEFTLSGYAAAAAPLTIYLLNDEGEYISRYAYALSVDGGGRFTFSMLLPQRGRYAAVLGLDSVILIYE